MTDLAKSLRLEADIEEAAGRVLVAQSLRNAAGEIGHLHDQCNRMEVCASLEESKTSLQEMEIEHLSRALKGCVDAHKKGQREPQVAAAEHAENVLKDLSINTTGEDE